jgi:hypothetical protein
MSLRFGLWLTEQGLISCDQFCGLVKIQQDSLPAPGAIALQRNLMSIRQVAAVNSEIEQTGGGDFLNIAVERRLIQPAVAELISRLQSVSAESITTLAIRCGLITAAQADVLYRHFLKSANRLPAQPAPAETPVAEVPAAGQAALPSEVRQPVPQPKFRQRPVIVHQYDVTY